MDLFFSSQNSNDNYFRRLLVVDGISFLAFHTSIIRLLFAGHNIHGKHTSLLIQTVSNYKFR